MKITLSFQQKLGLFLLFSLFAMAVLVYFFSPYTIEQQNLSLKLILPSSEHWLGTDQFGRDMLTRLASAILLSFSLSLLCMLTSSVLGVILGVCAAWSSGKIEQALDILVNILLAMPGLVLVLLFAAIAPGSFFILYLAISLIQWIEYYRVSKVLTKQLMTSAQLQLSQMMGFGKWYLFKRHILPTLAPSVFTMAAFGAANAILIIASLGFVFVGIQPPLAELGLMTVDLFPYYNEAIWILAQPLVAIGLLILGFHLIAGTNNDTYSNS